MARAMFMSHREASLVKLKCNLNHLLLCAFYIFFLEIGFSAEPIILIPT